MIHAHYQIATKLELKPCFTVHIRTLEFDYLSTKYWVQSMSIILEFDMLPIGDNLNTFYELISTYSIRLEQELCSTVHIHNLEFHYISTKYGGHTCVKT